MKDFLSTLLQDFNLDWQSFYDYLIFQEYFWITLGSCILLLFFWLQIRKRRRTIKLFKSQSGQVTVLRSALESLIKKICIDLTPSSNPKVYIRVKNSKLFIKVKLYLFTHQHLENTSIALQEKITKVLNENLGLEQVAAINILVAGFINDPHYQKNIISDQSEM